MSEDSLSTADRLRSHVEELAGHIGERNVFRPDALQAAADYISGEWNSQGYEVRSETYEARGVACSNLEVSHPGTIKPNEIILLGAHYDSVLGSPGANDNGSGVAALLEISRMLAATTTPMTVRCVAFVNEEPPFFRRGQMGSKVYARAARKRGDDIHLMIALETIGFYSSERGSQSYPPLFSFFFPKQGDFVAFVSNLRSRKQLSRFTQAFRGCSDFPVERIAAPGLVPGLAWSDHSSFWSQGYPALMVTDTAFYRYAFYHTAEDTPEKLCYRPLANVSEGIFKAVTRLAGCQAG